MLITVFLTPFRAVVRTQILIGCRGSRRVPRNGIQFVVAHDGEGSTGIDHAADDTAPSGPVLDLGR